MKLTIVAAGKLKEDYLRKAAEHYSALLSRKSDFSVLEVADEKTEGNPEVIKNAEGQRMMKKIQPHQYVIALAIDGRALSTEKFGKKLRQLAAEGKQDIVLVIGGSMGLSDEVLSRADFRLSFSPMTFPHQLMRIMLMEALNSAI